MQKNIVSTDDIVFLFEVEWEDFGFISPLEYLNKSSKEKYQISKIVIYKFSIENQIFLSKYIWY